MSVEWTNEDDFVAQVGEKFAQQVLGNMPSGSSVRFGETGEGVFPNYQVESSEGTTLWRGNGHGTWSGSVEEFNQSKVSKPFSREGIFEAFVRRYRKPRGSQSA